MVKFNDIDDVIFLFCAFNFSRKQPNWFLKLTLGSLRSVSKCFIVAIVIPFNDNSYTLKIYVDFTYNHYRRCPSFFLINNLPQSDHKQNNPKCFTTLSCSPIRLSCCMWHFGQTVDDKISSPRRVVHMYKGYFMKLSGQGSKSMRFGTIWIKKNQPIKM